jgi:cytochrome P450
MSDPKKFLRGVSNLSQWGGALAFLPPCLGDIGRKAFKFVLKEPGSEVIGTSTRDRVTSRYTLLREGQEPLRPDMLAKFVEAKKSDGSRLSQDEVLYTATSVIAAGSDTTSLALASTIRYLLANPQAYEKLQREVDEAFEHGRLSEPCSYAAAVKLPYLQACVKEALRLHPPISMSLPRVVPPEGDFIDGRFYPGGTIVSISPYVIHRDVNIWGQDAREYRPERWLEAEKSEEQRKDLERNFFSFGGGSRQCIGKNISIMEVTKCLPRLLWHFHFQATPRGRIDSPHTLRGRGDDGKWNEGEPWHVTSSWFLNAEQLWVDIRARRSDELEMLID